MANLTRFSVSIETPLLERFTDYARKHRLGNRSEALRTIIRDALVQDEWQSNKEIAGAITIVFDHHKHELAERLTGIQHDYHHLVLATTHIHLDHDNCLEMIAVRGRADQVQKIADDLIGSRGVKHGKLTITTIGDLLD